MAKMGQPMLPILPPQLDSNDSEIEVCPLAVLEWIVQMFLSSVLLVEITAFSASHPESLFRELIFKMIQVDIGTYVSTVISTSTEKWKQFCTSTTRSGPF